MTHVPAKEATVRAPEWYENPRDKGQEKGRGKTSCQKERS